MEREGHANRRRRVVQSAVTLGVLAAAIYAGFIFLTHLSGR